MLPIYLLTGIYFLKGKSNAIKLFTILTSNSRTEAMIPVSDRRWDFLCPFGSKEPDERKSRHSKIEHFEFTPVDHIHR